MNPTVVVGSVHQFRLDGVYGYLEKYQAARCNPWRFNYTYIYIYLRLIFNIPFYECIVAAERIRMGKINARFPSWERTSSNKYSSAIC